VSILEENVEVNCKEMKCAKNWRDLETNLSPIHPSDGSDLPSLNFSLIKILRRGFKYAMPGLLTL
jgi:hypothetical protein